METWCLWIRAVPSHVPVGVFSCRLVARTSLFYSRYFLIAASRISGYGPRGYGYVLLSSNCELETDFPPAKAVLLIWGAFLKRVDCFFILCLAEVTFSLFHFITYEFIKGCAKKRLYRFHKFLFFIWCVPSFMCLTAENNNSALQFSLSLSLLHHFFTLVIFKTKILFCWEIMVLVKY